jgi:hypothetical protein
MDKLEQYLDQVCRGIGGPRSLRQHIRQELREHLMDAIADHVRAGMAREEALTRALEDFGGPDQVRSELTALHGQRLLSVVVDKALEWKEKTMKARWLWASWALLVLVGIVAMEVLYILFGLAYLLPKFEKFAVVGVFDDTRSAGGEAFFSWAYSFLRGLGSVMRYTTWYLLGLAVVWALFEWRVKSENKSLMRQAALGTAALGLMVVVVLMYNALLLPFMVAVPGLIHRPPEQEIRAQLTTISRSLATFQQALATKNWAAMEYEARQAANAMMTLARTGAAAPTILSLDEQGKVDELRTQLKTAQNALWDIEQAATARDQVRLEAALKKLHQANLPPSVVPHPLEMKKSQ